MNNKFEMWTITVIVESGNMASIECENKKEVLEELKKLQESGQDMEYVNVFPPNSNLTLEQILSY